MTEKLKGKFRLRNQMSVEDRQRIDLEMEKYADEQERRKEEGFFPVGLESEEGKGCWESICWALNFEWNYSQNRHQIMESGISEEDELIRIRHSLADFQDSPPNLPKSEICVIEGVLIASTTYLCRRIGKPIPQSVFKKENSQLGQVKSPIQNFINNQIKSGELKWQKVWNELREKIADNKNTKTEDLTLHNFGGKGVYLRRKMEQTSNKIVDAIEYQVDGALNIKTVTRQDFGRMFREAKEKSESSETPQ